MFSYMILNILNTEIDNFIQKICHEDPCFSEEKLKKFFYPPPQPIESSITATSHENYKRLMCTISSEKRNTSCFSDEDLKNFFYPPQPKAKSIAEIFQEQYIQSMLTIFSKKEDSSTGAEKVINCIKIAFSALLMPFLTALETGLFHNFFIQPQTDIPEVLQKRDQPSPPSPPEKFSITCRAIQLSSVYNTSFISFSLLLKRLTEHFLELSSFFKKVWETWVAEINFENHLSFYRVEASFFTGSNYPENYNNPVIYNNKKIRKSGKFKQFQKKEAEKRLSFCENALKQAKEDKNEELIKNIKQYTRGTSKC